MNPQCPVLRVAMKSQKVKWHFFPTIKYRDWKFSNIYIWWRASVCFVSVIFIKVNEEVHFITYLDNKKYCAFTSVF